MRYVVSAAEMILPYLQPGNLVILESTSPPQTTTDLVKPILEQSGLNAGDDFYLAYSPERVLPGKILHELVNNDRVVGGINRKSGELARKLYQSFVKGEILLTNPVTAEMVKLMENTFRDVNIALANEFSRMAERLSFNIWEAIELANHHPRVNILRPGPGVGGHCISVDPWFLVETAPDITSLIHTSRNVNDMQPEFIVNLTKQILGNTDHKKIAVLGLAYKPDVDDFRESPAVDVVEALLNDGIDVCAYDPFIHDTNAPYLTDSLNQSTENADLLLILVAHSTFKQLSTSDISRMRKNRMFDVCNCLEHNQWRNAGFEVHILGDRIE
jgi:UDP-N-acetyl-D-mannosaminuronic acid dehydrogenase